MKSKKYQAYLDGPIWETIRLIILDRDDFTCQKCKKTRATQVHHRTYDRIYNEHPDDLISVCGSCHREIHGLDRNGRKMSVIGKVLAKVIG